MRARRLLAVAAGAVMAVGMMLVPAAQAADLGSATVRVSPSYGLRGGDTVSVRASGLPASTPVRVMQCDSFDLVEWNGCDVVVVLTTSRYGTLWTRIIVKDVLDKGYWSARGEALYCRADRCRIGLLTLPGEYGEYQVLAESAPLIFRGSPATVTVQPSDGLANYQWVHVTGTAYGAAGRPVRLVEQGCYDIIQDAGCYGALRPVWTLVNWQGRYSAWYRVHRFLTLSDQPVDCADPDNVLGSCVISATVYRWNGTPDDSFGVEWRGQPMADLHFGSDAS